jgi:hypothetical protein
MELNPVFAKSLMMLMKRMIKNCRIDKASRRCWEWLNSKEPRFSLRCSLHEKGGVLCKASLADSHRLLNL